nr:NADH dehydrogenase subunit 2 [Trichophilopterus babakotophilus]
MLLMLFCNVLILMFSNTWYVSWIALELSTFFFIPFVKGNEQNESIFFSFSMWKYFIVQSISSACFFLSFLLDSSGFLVSLGYENLSDFTFFLASMSILVKLGMVPFHSWMLEITENMNWKSFLILNTVQKIGPLFLLWNLFYSCNLSFVFINLAILSSISSILALFDYSIRHFLIYSSIMNSSWIVLSMLYSKFSMFMFMFVYFISFSVLIYLIQIHNFPSYSSMYYSSSGMSFGWKICKILMIMNISGTPPMIMFFLKVDVLEKGILILNFVSTGVILFLSMNMVYMYLVFSIYFMLSTKEMKNYKMKMNNLNYFVIFWMIFSFFGGFLIYI